MFENLSDKLLSHIKKLKNRGRITEENIQETIKAVRLSLLEADVNFKVVKTFTDRVKAKALGSDMLKEVSAGQLFVKIIQDELTAILGGVAQEIDLKGRPGDPAVIFLVGLQGAGKTTSTAKLALYIRKKLKKKVGMVPVDVYRPAAIEQLVTLGKANNIDVYPSSGDDKPEDILAQAKKWADENHLEVLLVDTAGRNQIDDALMEELGRLKQVWSPREILLVADAMLGQQSVNVAQGFHERLSLTGMILTKVDGDARGGAALSIRETTGIAIKFVGVGEKVNALEVFHPERLSSRILDMGDVVSLVEQAQEHVSEAEAIASAKKMAKNQFTMEDFLKQIRMLKKMGGLESIMKFLPGMGDLKKKMKNMAPPDDEVKKIEAIICSMTPLERSNHKVLNGSRRLRIAKGSGMAVTDINRFVKQFEQAQKMMSQMMKMGMKGGGRGMGMPF